MTKILDFNLAVDAASAHLWKELNSPVNKTPYATYAEFKAADPIGADEWEAAMERTLRVAQGQQANLKAALKTELLDHLDEIAPNQEYLRSSMVIAWGIAKGLPIENARQLAGVLVKTPNLKVANGIGGPGPTDEELSDLVQKHRWDDAWDETTPRAIRKAFDQSRAKAEAAFLSNWADYLTDLQNLLRPQLSEEQWNRLFNRTDTPEQAAAKLRDLVSDGRTDDLEPEASASPRL